MRPNKGEEESGERQKMNNLNHRRTRIENYYKRRVKPQARFGYERHRTEYKMRTDKRPLNNLISGRWYHQ